MNRQRVAAGTAALALAGGMFTAGRFTAPEEPSPEVLDVKQVMFASFLTQCGFSHRLPDDPIVAPNAPGFSHSHDFFSNRSTNARSTYESMRAGTTTCNEPGDTAGYWAPTLYVNGVPRGFNASHTRIYYANPDTDTRAGSSNEMLLGVHYTFPPDFRMIAGNAAATSPEQNPLVPARRIRWSCYPDGIVPNPDWGQPPPTGCKSTATKQAIAMDLYIVFPFCWVGNKVQPGDTVNGGGWVIDSPDHKRHVTYAAERGGCPSTHPFVLPQLTFNVRYKPWDSGFTLAGGTSGSNAPWYTAHADYLNAWDQGRLEALTATTPPADART